MVCVVLGSTGGSECRGRAGELLSAAGEWQCAAERCGAPRGAAVCARALVAFCGVWWRLVAFGVVFVRRARRAQTPH